MSVFNRFPVDGYAISSMINELTNRGFLASYKNKILKFLTQGSLSKQMAKTFTLAVHPSNRKKTLTSSGSFHRFSFFCTYLVHILCVLLHISRV